MGGGPGSIRGLVTGFHSIPVFCVARGMISILISNCVPAGGSPLGDGFRFKPVGATVDNGTVRKTHFHIKKAAAATFDEGLFFSKCVTCKAGSRGLGCSTLIRCSFGSHGRCHGRFPLGSVHLRCVCSVGRLKRRCVCTDGSGVFLT